MYYRRVTLAEHHEFLSTFQYFHTKSWPKYLTHGETSGREYFANLFTDFSDFQVILLDEQNTVVGCANTIPVVWDGSIDGLPYGWGEALEQGCLDYQAGRQPNTLCALAAMISPDRRGEGISRKLLEAMKEVGAKHGLTAMIAPVRPTWKSKYPLTPIDRYASWKRNDGTPFDPWVRTHWRIGAKILKVAPESPVITGTVSQWKEWTAMEFPESGLYLPPSAPEPLEIDLEQDCGRLAEPNIWMVHSIEHGHR